MYTPEGHPVVRESPPKGAAWCQVGRRRCASAGAVPDPSPADRDALAATKRKAASLGSVALMKIFVKD